jgi:hypothetical protein
MSKIRNSWTVAIAIVLLALGVTIPVLAQTASAPPAPPDSTLFTTYSLYSSDTTVDWVVCGATQETEGCYAAGSLGPFGRVGAMLEGKPSVKGSTVTRAIYVVDAQAASGVELFVYKKTDTVSAESDTVTVTLAKTVNLPLTGGSSASCSMAANTGYLFIGTDQSPQAVEVKKSDLSVTQIGGFSPPINVTAITADSYGNVTVTQGDLNSGENGFYVFGPTGGGEEDGGGASFMLETTGAFVPSAVPPAEKHHAPTLGYKAKTAQGKASSGT